MIVRSIENFKTVVALLFTPGKPFKLRASMILKIVQIVQCGYYRGKTKSLRSSVTNI